MSGTAGLRAAHDLRLAHDRSVGGATGAFLTGLARAEIWGGRGTDGRVSVPPREGEVLVRVGDRGVVRRWSWVSDPERGQPLDRPFAYVLVRLDGADTSLLHVADVDSVDALADGLRVRADWRTERCGSILDLRAFVPGRGVVEPPPVQAEPERLRVTSDRTMHYAFEPGHVLSSFYRGLVSGRIEGGRCEVCAHVHVPPRVRCPTCGAGPMSTVEVTDRGRIESFTEVHLPVDGSGIEVPFTWARVRLDGADVSFPHLVAGGDVLRPGGRVVAVWAPAGDRRPTWEAIRHFRPVER